jgi:hypothetical protein
MSQIAQLGGEILKQLTVLGRKTADFMLPGLSEGQIRQKTAELPFRLPHSAVELYMWSEGLDPKAGLGTEFFPGYGMDSLTDMLGSYNTLSKAPEYPRFHAGKLRWFPLFRSGGTDFYGILWGKKETADGQIVYDDNEGSHRDNLTPPVTKFNSLEAMLKSLLRAYQTGVYHIEEGRLVGGTPIYYDSGERKGQRKSTDYSRFRAIARELNPGLKAWQ